MLVGFFSLCIANAVSFFSSEYFESSLSSRFQLVTSFQGALPSLHEQEALAVELGDGLEPRRRLVHHAMIVDFRFGRAVTGKRRSPSIDTCRYPDAHF